ncbi:MAG TPA: hypothetical protein VIF60_05890, partial [Burkholderiaceae bacterium]
TGRQWIKTDNGAGINWNDAGNWCWQKGGGFRLPSPEELRSLMGRPKVFHLTGEFYWTNLPYSYFQTFVLQIDNGMRFRTDNDIDGANYRVLCTR